MFEEVEIVLGMLRHEGCAGTGVKVTDGVVVQLFPNVQIPDVLTIVWFIPSTVVFGITMVGKAAGGGGGNGFVTIPTISLMFLFVLFPGSTRGGGCGARSIMKCSAPLRD